MVTGQTGPTPGLEIQLTTDESLKDLVSEVIAQSLPVAAFPV